MNVLKVILFFVCSNILFALNIDNSVGITELLSYSKIYIDKSNSITIEEIQSQHFQKNNQKTLAFGYSPNITVWVKFKLENSSNKKIEKIIEYANPIGYLVKPFKREDLKSTLQLAIYKMKNNKSIETNLTFIGNGYVYDLDKHNLFFKEHPIKLSKNESLLFETVPSFGFRLSSSI